MAMEAICKFQRCREGRAEKFQGETAAGKAKLDREQLTKVGGWNTICAHLHAECITYNYANNLHT